MYTYEFVFNLGFSEMCANISEFLRDQLVKAMYMEGRRP